MRTCLVWLLAAAVLLSLTGCEKAPQTPETTEETMGIVQDSAPAEADIRRALGLLLERSYIGEDLLQGGWTPAPSLVAAGISDWDGSRFWENAGNGGYFSVSKLDFEINYAQAYGILSRYFAPDKTGLFSDFPELVCLCPEEAGELGDYLCSALGAVGVPVQLNLVPAQDYDAALEAGDYHMALCTRTALYDDPLAFLTQWTSRSPENLARLGQGAHASAAIFDLDLTESGYDVSVVRGTWAQTYDVLLNTILSCGDPETRYALMHRAEDLLMASGAVTPLCFRAQGYLINEDVEGVFRTPAGVFSFRGAGVNGGGRSLSVCLQAPVDTLDPAQSAGGDGDTLVSHLFSGLARWEQDREGRLAVVPDCARSLPEGVVNGDGTVTYTYILKPEAKWSDGQPLTAQDFVFAWNRAADIARAEGRGELWEMVKGYDEGTALAVQAVGTDTLEVTLTAQVPYWNQLLAMPAYFPVREDVVSAPGWTANPAAWVSNGSYVLTGWEHNALIRLSKNDTFHDSDTVTMQELRIYLSDSPESMLANFRNGFYQVVSTVPQEQTDQLKAESPEVFFQAGGMETGFLVWNMDRMLLPQT